MKTLVGCFSVFFEDPFWIGVSERTYGNKREVARVVFGAEPTELEIQRFLLEHWDSLNYSPSLDDRVKEHPRNAKRAFRQVRKEMKDKGIGTKSQQSLSVLHEQDLVQRKGERRRTAKERNQLLYAIRKEQLKEKHKGH